METTSSPIQTRHDQKRGCGWRKPGGYYLVASGLATPCGRLPIPLTVCPCCSAGIKFCRGWTWINLAQIAAAAKQTCLEPTRCGQCPMDAKIERAGLLWIGEKFYSPEAFTAEAARLGVSRRISTVPREFKAGETWIALAHIKAARDGEGEPAPGIFHLFRPRAIEYVVKGDETAEEIDRLVKRGITPVKVEMADKEPELASE
jgi:hypothetical protein